MYKVVGIIKNSIKIEFSDKGQPYTFDTEEEAVKFKEYIKENEVCPDGCRLEVESVKETSN